MQRLVLLIALPCLVALAGALIEPGQAGAQQAPGQWKGLVAGRSGLNEVYVALGRPKKTQPKGDETQLFWPADVIPGLIVPVKNNMVVMRQDVVQYMMVADAGAFEIDPKKMLEKMGKPQGITPAAFSADSSYYHYPLRGVSFLVDAGPNQAKPSVVYEIVYAPTDWTTLQATFTWARPMPMDVRE
jgi:hypothetical protein